MKEVIATKEELIKMGYYQVIEEKDEEIERLKNIITENTKKDIDYNKNIETKIQQLFSKELTEVGRKKIINDFINMDKEIERLNNIIKEVREYIEIQQEIFKDYDVVVDTQLRNILYILNILKGEDKE